MSQPEYADYPEPEECRQVLLEFTELAEQTVEVDTLEQLEDILSPEVTVALTGLILQTGHTPRYAKSQRLKVLDIKRGNTIVGGAVNMAPVTREPSSIELQEHRRLIWPLPYRPADWAVLQLRDLGRSSAVREDGKHYLLAASDSYTNTEDKEKLNALLRVSANLTSQLIRP